MSRQPWSQEQDRAIGRLVEQIGLNDWSQVAASLKENYPFSKRTGKQCRERWYNHLNPAVSKLPWTTFEEHRLFQMHKTLGNRWKDISKSFPGRTDNDIKNHFYSTLRRSLRRLNKILGQRNSTSQMREIKPSVLTTIMSFNYGKRDKDQSELSDYNNSIKDLPSLIFEFSNFKPIKNSPSPANLDEVKEKIAAIFELISQFNQEYENLKVDRRQIKSRKTEKINLKLDNIKLVAQKPQLFSIDDLQKDILKTQIWIKQAQDPMIEHFEFNLQSLSQEYKSHIQVPSQKNYSQWSLQAEEDNIQLGDLEQPSKNSHEGENGEFMRDEDQRREYDYEVRAQDSIWADQIHL